MSKFEIGQQYSMRSICDHECVWTYTVTARTAQTITVTDGKEISKLRISKKYSESARPKRCSRWASIPWPRC